MTTDFGLQEGAFDEAVQGVNAIMHTASPFIVATKVDGECHSQGYGFESG